MWFKLNFYDNRGNETSLLGTISPANAGIFIDAESVANTVGARPNSFERRIIFRRAQRFLTLTDGHPGLRRALPEYVSNKKMLTLEKTALLLFFFSEGGLWSEMARILAADDFQNTITHSLADDWFHHWANEFFDPDRAVVVNVYPGSGDSNTTTVQSVLKQITSLMLEIYDSIENDENRCNNY